METSNFHNDSENQNKYESENNLNHDIKQAVSDVAVGMLEEVLYKLTEERAESFEICREAVMDSQVDETAIIGLSVSDEIDLIEQFADDFGFGFGDVAPDSLRNRIDGIATWIVRSLGEQEALVAIEALESWVYLHKGT